jgi:hypothetical protein
MNTKKILLYSGGALIVGAVGFFVWSFFQKVEVPMAESDSKLAEEDKPTSTTNPFSSMGIDYDPIKSPTIKYDLDWLFRKN